MREQYEKWLRDDETRRNALLRSVTLVSYLRLVSFIIALFALGLLVWGHLGDRAWAIIAIAVLAFFGLVLGHTRLFARLRDAEARCAYNERGIRRLEGLWRQNVVPDVAEEPSHPFSEDLDVLGRFGLWHYLDPACTPFGQARLREALLCLPSMHRARARQDAVRELSALHDLRKELAVWSLREDVRESFEKGGVERFAAWAKASGGIPNVAIPAVALTSLFVLVAAFGYFGVTPRWAWMSLAAASFVWSMAWSSRTHAALSSAPAELEAFVAVFDLVEKSAAKSEILRDIIAKVGTPKPASVAMLAFARTLSFVAARNNEVFRFFIGPVLLWDLHCALSLERWRKRFGNNVDRWLTALGELEELCILATFAFEHPAYAWPVLEDAPVLEATALGHPLVGNCVENDIAALFPGKAWLVTGSNMSGKSTLLRSLGISLVLAYAGAPIRASFARLGPARIVTSLRVSDSIAEGVSRFFAELTKVKRVVDAAEKKDEAPVFFLLDEIFSGTNSRERHEGARKLLTHLLDKGAFGAISTHDLELVGSNVDPRVRLVHFEEQVDGEQMTFDYRLREGPVTTSNALRLMRQMGFSFLNDDRV